MATNRTTAGKTTTKKSPAKESPAKKSPAKSPAKASPAKKSPATERPATESPAKEPQKQTAAPGKSEDNYTRPELREKIKQEVTAGDKGGRAGQWSARKAQLVAHEYVAEGGEYKHPRSATQQSLKQWGEEKWHTADGKPAIRDDGKGSEATHRYLPDKAWQELSPEEKKATDDKKVRGSRKGRQFVPNTAKASQARKHAEE